MIAIKFSEQKLCRKSLPVRLAAYPLFEGVAAAAPRPTRKNPSMIHVPYPRNTIYVWYKAPVPERCDTCSMFTTELRMLLSLQASHGRGEVLARQLAAQEVVRIVLHPAHGHIARGLGALAVEPNGDVLQLGTCSLCTVLA